MTMEVSRAMSGPQPCAPRMASRQTAELCTKIETHPVKNQAGACAGD
jgi:hypothetical protein